MQLPDLEGAEDQSAFEILAGDANAGGSPG
jgi:hypothetical protein